MTKIEILNTIKDYHVREFCYYKKKLEDLYIEKDFCSREINKHDNCYKLLDELIQQEKDKEFKINMKECLGV